MSMMFSVLCVTVLTVAEEQEKLVENPDIVLQGGYL